MDSTTTSKKATASSNPPAAPVDKPSRRQAETGKEVHLSIILCTDVKLAEQHGNIEIIVRTLFKNDFKRNRLLGKLPKA